MARTNNSSFFNSRGKKDQKKEKRAKKEVAPEPVAIPETSTATYVSFVFRDMPPNPDAASRAVKSRDIASLSLPGDVIGFYFYDAPKTTEGSKITYGETINLGPTHYIAEAVVTPDMIQAEAAEVAGQAGKAMQKRAERAQKRGGVYAKIGTGFYVPLAGDDIVISREREVIYPAKKAAPVTSQNRTRRPKRTLAASR